MIEFLCQRYHCLPSQVMAEDAGELLRIVSLVNAGHPADEE